MLPRICVKFKLKYFLATVGGLYLLYFFGAFTHFFEKDFEATFDYPLNGDILSDVYQLRHGQQPARQPINRYNYSYITSCEHKCKEDDRLMAPRLVFIVKSAIEHFDRRAAIRKSWGYERRFADVKIRTVFMLGRSRIVPNRRLQSLVDLEYSTYRDIVQGDFVDDYFNNTIKTMMGFRWAVTYCPRAKFYMFADDDFYVSAKNLLRYVRNPVNYPEYLEETDEALRKLARRLAHTTERNGTAVNQSVTPVPTGAAAAAAEAKDRTKRQLMQEMELPPNVKLFSGFVFRSAPHRHRSSKWYVSLDEYPWDMWPTYVTAGAFLLSHEALFEMYYVSMYTKHFRFDDIFLGIVAMKAGIEPLHSEEFYFHKAPYLGPQSYKYVLATHGYDDLTEMTKVWNEVRASGYA